MRKLSFVLFFILFPFTLDISIYLDYLQGDKISADKLHDIQVTCGVIWITISVLLWQDSKKEKQ